MGSWASQASAVAASLAWDIRHALETGVFCQVRVLCTSGPPSLPGEATSLFEDSFRSPHFRTSLLMPQPKTQALPSSCLHGSIRHRAPGRFLSFRDSRCPQPGLGPEASVGEGPLTAGAALWGERGQAWIPGALSPILGVLLLISGCTFLQFSY